MVNVQGCDNTDTLSCFLEENQSNRTQFGGRIDITDAATLSRLVDAAEIPKSTVSTVSGFTVGSQVDFIAEKQVKIVFRRDSPKHEGTIGRLVLDKKFRDKIIHDQDGEMRKTYCFKSDNEEIYTYPAQITQDGIAKNIEVENPSKTLQRIVGSLILDVDFRKDFYHGKDRDNFITAFTDNKLKGREIEVLRDISEEQINQLANQLDPDILLENVASVYVLFPKATGDESGANTRYSPFSWMEAMSKFFKKPNVNFGHNAFEALGHSHVIIVGSATASPSICDEQADNIARRGLPEKILKPNYKPITVRRIEGRNAKEIKESANHFLNDKTNGFTDFLRK